MAQEYRQNESYETIKRGYSSPTIEVNENEGDSSTGNRYSLPFGLCKGVGIDTTGMTPREAWDAYTSKTGISKEDAEKEHWGKSSNAESSNARSLHTSTLYPINEDMARRSKEAVSFDSYVKGSATEAYKKDVARFDKNVNDLIARYKSNDTLTENDWNRVYILAGAYSKNRADFTNEYNRINASYPSWAIAGPAKYNTSRNDKKMRSLNGVFNNQGANIDPDKNDYLTKIESILSNRNIKSNDENAVAKLQAKYNGLKAELERGKQMNAYFRKNKTLAGFPGISEETARKFDAANASGDYFSRQPFAAYRLQNGNAELRRIQERIDSLNKAKETANTSEGGGANYPKAKGVTVQENAEQMRVQLRFDGKPDEETRTMLKSHGFRWSPSQGAWQRQLNGNGKYAAKQVMETLSKKK